VNHTRSARLADYPIAIPGHVVGYRTPSAVLEPSQTWPPKLTAWSARLHFVLARTWLKLRLPERGFLAFARLAVIDQGHPLAARFTARELTRLAHAAHAAGRGDEANGVLRLLIAKIPRLTAPRVALLNVLLDTNSYQKAEIEAIDAVRHFPFDSEVLLRLAMVQSQLRQFDKAIQTLKRSLKLDPTNARGWFEYGKVVRELRLNARVSTRAFDRAGKLGIGDSELLEQVARQFADELDYEKAVYYYQRLLAVDSRARKRPCTLRRYAMALKDSGREEDANAIIDSALRICRISTRLRNDDTWEDLKQQESLLLFDHGFGIESEAALRAIRRRRSVYGVRYDRLEYLPETKQRLGELKQIIAGRDTFVFLQGPCFADFSARANEFAQFDFATATLSAFPPVEQALSKINRLVDVLLISHPSSFRSWYPELNDFLNRPSRNLLITSRYALSGLFELGTDSDEFLARHDKRLILAHPMDGPPLPHKPLHFECGNSLTLLLPLLILGRPRRIFIFGADGGTNPQFRKRAYFYNEDYDLKTSDGSFTSRRDLISFQDRPDRLHEANRRFRVDALNADRIISAAIRSLAGIFDVPIPPIVNVCPHSTHQLFERKSIDETLTRLCRGDE
jgi:tetratricopeptide (TPR) repeat protein